ALTHRKKSLEICKKNTIPVPFELLANIATDYKSLKKTDSALVFYEKAKQIAINTNDVLSLAKVNHNLGELYNDLQDYKTSLEYLMKSYEYAQQVRHNFLLAVNTDYLSRVYENLGNPSKALQFLQEHRQWIDSVYQQSTNRKLEEFDIKYDVKQKDEKIAELDRENMLKAKIIAQKQQQTLLFIFITLIIITSILIWQNSNKKRLLAQQESLRLKSIIEAEQKERKRIAQDLHDSLGQSLSALKMQASAIQSSSADSAKYKTLLQQVDSTYDELRDISHNIMPNILIRLGLIPAIRELISDIATEGSQEIQLEHNNDFNTLDDGQSINLYRIIQEALVNIIKHAEATLVTISLEQHQDTLSLYIKDNGKGMKVSKMDNHDGMGWKNIYSRAALLSAKIDVTSAHGKGTSIALQLKSK
ncbi:MAG: sensor histidine kinase, partial [Bacteroidota bacterium]